MCSTSIKSGILYGLLLVILCSACGQKNGPQITVEDYLFVEDFPSASGIESTSNNAIYVVGDDSYDLRKYSKDWQLQLSYPLVQKVEGTKRIPKSMKPDYESLCWLDKNETLLLLTGSGSESPNRDLAVIMNMQTGRQLGIKVLTDFYEHIWNKAGYDGDKINIEGMLNTGEEIFMFHRGNLNENIAIKVKREDFYNYLRGKSNQFPKIEFTRYELPEFNGYKAGMSGADYVKEKNAIVFTASVEGTSDEVADGEVLGSFIGWIDLKQPEKIVFCQPLKKDGEMWKTKLEGVACMSVKENKVQLITVSDDDKGNSELFRVNLEL